MEFKICKKLKDYVKTGKNGVNFYNYPKNKTPEIREGVSRETISVNLNLVINLQETITVLTVRVKKLKEQLKLVRQQNEELERLLEFRLNEAIHSQSSLKHLLFYFNLINIYIISLNYIMDAEMIEKNWEELSRLKAEEKDLLKQRQAEGSWSSGPPCSRLYEDVKAQIKRGDAAMNPFHNVDA